VILAELIEKITVFLDVTSCWDRSLKIEAADYFEVLVLISQTTQLHMRGESSVQVRHRLS
jgi:hypothetical protein